MKRVLILTIILFFAFIRLLLSQNNQAKLIFIRYNIFFTQPAPDFSTRQSINDCNRFDLWGRGDCLMIEDTELINSFIEKLHSGVKDTILSDEKLMNNIGAKIIIYNDPLPNDIICVNKKTYYLINGILIKDEEFVDYIKKLIIQVDDSEKSRR